ncbi:hypothetical protein FJY90_07290 [Candidatus Gottesmanbacteria bacterium]|nr:hypothetical protein [Candidatus Gottesmanbacteria bacterium]
MPTKGWGEATTELIKGTVKGTAKVAPDIIGGMIEMATKSAANPQKTQQQYQQKVQEYKKKDEEELEKIRNSLVTSTPAHLRPLPKSPPLRPYEARLREEEQKKAMMVEAQKKQQQQPIGIPAGKKKTGWFFNRKKTKGSEGLVKDTKIG